MGSVGVVLGLGFTITLWSSVLARSLHPSLGVVPQHPITSVCYELKNGQRFLFPSRAVDPNREYWRLAALTLNETVPGTAWKLLPTVDSCFRVCNPETGLYLMVVTNSDLAYTVPPRMIQQQQQPHQAFAFGLHYPQWPASLDALITSALKLHQLCISLDVDPNEDKLVGVYHPRTTASHPDAECRWRLHTVPCPTVDRC